VWLVLASLAGLAITAAILITSNLDAAIKMVVEGVGSKATGTREIVIDKFRTTYEVSPPHGSNIGAIQANVTSFATSVGKVVHTDRSSEDRRFI